MGFVDSIKSGFARYFDFGTRSSRSEYWWWILFACLGAIIIAIVEGLLLGPKIEQTDTEFTVQFGGGIVSSLFSLLVIIPTNAITCRRLHDIRKSGWWQLIILIPLIGFFILLYWMVRRGDDGGNRFGANPLSTAA